MPESFDSTALSLAAMNGDQVTLNALIKAGADVNRKNIYDWTALKAALVPSDIKCVKLLVQAGADVRNTLIWAVKNKTGSGC